MTYNVNLGKADLSKKWSLNVSNLELSKTLVIKHSLISMPKLSERLLRGNNFKPFKKYFCEFKKRSTVCESKKAAFTLAETMIVLVVLGVIATLTVPNLVNKQRETTQRTKLKKAMALYETAVNKMILENDRSFSGLNEAGCNKTIAHFKYIKRDSNNGCIFQTSDKIWWDLTDIQRPIISFKEITSANREDVVIKANTADDKTAFVMVGRFDDNGILRVDDLGYESIPGNSQQDAKGYESKDQVEKLYGFTGAKNIGEKEVEKAYCICNESNCCSSNCSEKLCLEKQNNCVTPRSSISSVYGGYISYSSKTCAVSYKVYDADRNDQGQLYLYDDGSAIHGGKYYAVKNGNLTMGINEGRNNISDYIWDENGNLIKAKSSALGVCSTESCNINPSPLEAEACKNGRLCHYDATSGEWRSGTDWDNDDQSKMDAHKNIGDLIFENYQNAINK